MSEKGAAQRNGPASHSDILAPLWKKNVSFGWVKLKKSLPNFFCGSMIPIKCTFCKKNWTKTLNPALSSDLNFFPPPISGRHHQVDDQQRYPNMNNKDHLVGQLTRGALYQLPMPWSSCSVARGQMISGGELMP